jgi:hypothetical protein
VKIFYLNCFRLLKNNKDGQRDKLYDYVRYNDIDVVCLAESSNYNFAGMFPGDIFPDDERYRWKAPKESALSKGGWKFHICSKLPVKFESIDYFDTIPDNLLKDSDPDVLADFGIGTMISLKFEDSGDIIVPVHIQFKNSKSQIPNKSNAFYEYGLRKLKEYMIMKNPIVVFGDFNNYPEDESFKALTTDTGYRKANTDDVAYSYRSNPNDSGVLIDHAFTNSEKVKMEYVNAIEEWHFNHHGMLITIE